MPIGLVVCNPAEEKRDMTPRARYRYPDNTVVDRQIRDLLPSWQLTEGPALGTALGRRMNVGRGRRKKKGVPE